MKALPNSRKKRKNSLPKPKPDKLCADKAHTVMALHPTTRILIGLSLIFTSSALDFFPLTVAVLLLASILWVLGDGIAWRWVRRARLLLFIPPLVSGYITAGDGVFPSFNLWSPTWQGLAHGTLQSLRLLVALLGLRLIMRPLSRERMTSGLTTLLSPFSYFGADVSCFTRRLSLTLAYLEQFDGRQAGELLRGALPYRVVPFQVKEPQVSAAPPLGLVDATLIALTLVILYRLLS